MYSIYIGRTEEEIIVDNFLYVLTICQVLFSTLIVHDGAFDLQLISMVKRGIYNIYISSLVCRALENRIQTVRPVFSSGAPELDYRAIFLLVQNTQPSKNNSCLKKSLVTHLLKTQKQIMEFNLNIRKANQTATGSHHYLYSK